MKFFVFSYNGNIRKEKIVNSLALAVALTKEWGNKYGSNTGFERVNKSGL